MLCALDTLASRAINSSKIEDVDLVLLDSDMTLNFIHEIHSVAEYIAIDKNEESKITAWSWFKLNGAPGMVYIPERDIESGIIVKLPPGIASAGEKNISYVVTPETFGLICTIIATANVLMHLKEKRGKHLGSDKKMLGLINRRLDRNIEFFSELHANIHSSLNKILEVVSTKNPNGNAHTAFTSNELNDVFLLLNDYSALMAGDINMQKHLHKSIPVCLPDGFYIDYRY